MTRNGGILESLIGHVYEHSFWKWHRNVPVFLARIMAIVNIHSKKLPQNPYYVRLPSYDGSKQLTHPDLVSWRGSLWLTATPYPYSLESYEHPCVYWSRDGYRWQPSPGAYPLEKIKASQIGGTHCSDPVLLPGDESLMLFYRKRVRAGSEVTDSLYRSICSDGIHWSSPQKISESMRNHYISPAVLHDDKSYIMFHIDLYDHQQTGRLILRRSCDSVTWDDSQECKICGLKPDTGLWHIGICAGSGSRETANGRLAGLFVIKNRNGEYHGVYRADSTDAGLTWNIGEKLLLPLELTKDMKKPYKASFIPESDDIIISLEDRQGRWYIYRVPCDTGDGSRFVAPGVADDRIVVSSSGQQVKPRLHAAKDDKAVTGNPIYREKPDIPSEH